MWQRCGRGSVDAEVDDLAQRHRPEFGEVLPDARKERERGCEQAVAKELAAHPRIDHLDPPDLDFGSASATRAAITRCASCSRVLLSKRTSTSSIPQTVIVREAGACIATRAVHPGPKPGRSLYGSFIG